MPINSSTTDNHFSSTAIMGKEGKLDDQIKNAAAALEVQANSAQGINREGVAKQADATYMECRRNHAVSVGGFIIDYCWKFVKGGQDETKEALLCAKCGCHRSFHRKVVPPIPPNHLDARYYNIMNYLCSLPLTMLQPRAPTPWPMRSPAPPNSEIVEGQGSSSNPDEAGEKPESNSGDEINRPSSPDVNKKGKRKARRIR